jgi:regulator of sirC expression with transglutaminase-like and TPR domain
MDATARFVEFVGRSEGDVDVEEGALLIAAHAYPDLDVAAERAQLDELAEGCPPANLEGWRRHLFVDLGFSGNQLDYYDPRNSFLNDVVRRRLGIPITLAVVGMALGRRAGLALSGVSMPGHFLLRVDDHPDTFVDPFDGRLLDPAGCQTLFQSVHGDRARLDPSHLRPVGPRAILTRMLANLQGIYERRGDHDSLAWIMSLKLSVPGAPQLN